MYCIFACLHVHAHLQVHQARACSPCTLLTAVSCQTQNETCQISLIKRPKSSAGEAIQLELACEPSNILQAAVEMRQLAQLPPALTPPGGMQAWLLAGSCCLLQPAGAGLVKVS